MAEDDAKASTSTDEVLEQTRKLRRELERMVARLDNFTTDLRRELNRRDERGAQP